MGETSEGGSGDTCRDGHRVTYRSVESPYRTPETNTTGMKI